MTLTHVTLARSARGGVEAGAAALRDILWAYVLAGDPVEHISVRAGPGPRLEIGIFTGPTVGRPPATIAYELVERALGSSPALDRWQFADIQPSSLIVDSGPQ